MELKQLKLNKNIVEKAKDGMPIITSNDEKVDLDYLANYWDNIIKMVEMEMGRKPVAFRLVIERKE